MGHGTSKGSRDQWFLIRFGKLNEEELMLFIQFMHYRNNALDQVNIKVNICFTIASF